MPDPNKSHGGARPNAGRPVVTRTLRLGQQLLYHLHNAAGQAIDMPQMAYVRTLSRTLIEIELESGDTIRLGY